MSHIALVSVFCPDRTGLIAAIAGRMFDLGANLGDTTFAVLGSGAEFTSITELPDAIENETLAAELASVPELAEAKITVTDFELDPIQDQAGKMFIEYNPNIVRLSSEKTPDGNYILRISVSIPEGSAESCLATVANTAEGLQLSCDVETP